MVRLISGNDSTGERVAERREQMKRGAELLGIKCNDSSCLFPHTMCLNPDSKHCYKKGAQ